ncbi:MAG TPA: alkaline phosphatase D family protein [Pseudomonadota bacterium]|jgi:alkaline phosphatase D|nr:alkaline phosphatase D family protein [Pseudomonadota bacterium]
MHRRTFLKVGALALAMPSAGAGCDGNWWADKPIANSAVFPNGVIAGSPEERAITFLVLCESVEGHPAVGIEIATDPQLEHIIYRGVIPILPQAPRVPLKFRLEDDILEPKTRYHYRFLSKRTETPIASFQTLRSPDDPSPVRLAYFSCQGYSAGYYTAHRHLAAEPNIDLVACLGDYIYDLTDDVGPEERPDKIGTISKFGNGLAQTLDEYRQKYAYYRTDGNLQAMHAAHSFVAIWDNHELAADGERDGITPTLPWAQRMRNGMQAFWDFMPQYPGKSLPLTRKLRLGQHAELFLLDMWTYQNPDVRNRTYLGREQIDWLLDGLRKSTATWKIIASTTVMMSTDYPAGRPINLGQWDGFSDERRLILEAMLSDRIENVIVISGDLHTFLAGQVTTTGRADGKPVALEFCGGAISSFGLFDLLPSDRSLAARFATTASSANPHWSFVDLLTRGYAVVEARPDELLVTLRGVETTFEPQSDVFDVAVFRVAKGSKVIETISTAPV